MAKQYQCEYCQRSFHDTRKDRQKHRKSQEHLRKKFEYEFYLLKCLTEKFGQKNFESLFNREDLNRLQEVLSKSNGCKYHFEPTTISTLTTRCRYGLHCKHSHQLNDQQIHHYRHYFLNILSRKSIQNQLKQPEQQMVDWSNKSIISKNQLRKELLLNIWLEKRFKFDPDKRIDLIIGLI